MTDTRGRKTRRSAARSPRPRTPFRRESLAVLAHRTNDLFVELAKLSARLERLEEALWGIRAECAKLVQQKLGRLREHGGPSRGPGRRRLGAPRLSLTA